jgi:hypothetical protein
MRIDSVTSGIALPRFEHLEGFPGHLLDVAASDLWRHLAGPTLFEIAGRQGGPLFLSVLLHGDEDSGWRAAQAVLRRHRGVLLPRPLLLFVGNIEAARGQVRTLSGQEDYNRTWPGTAEPDTPLARLMREVVGVVRAKAPFASIDIHNNSGHNPHYACVNRLDETHLHLARLFSRTVVYFERPLGVQSGAFAPICPAVTVECGRAGEPASVAHAAELIEAALALQRFPNHPVPEHDLDLMRTFAIIKVPPDASFSFDGAAADFRFRADLDHLNFSELEPGAVLGRVGHNGGRLDIDPANDLVAADRYFDYAGGEIKLVQRAVPAMLTVDPNAVRLDCLGYLMHRIGRDGRRIVE